MTARETHRAWARKNAAHLRQYRRKWREKNRERVRAYNRKHYKYDAVKARDKALRRKFGIDLLTYEAMRAAQKNKCAICRTSVAGGKGDWHVDHDHNTGAVRQLLCQNCNIGLGNFQEDTAILLAAINYLQRHKKLVILKPQGEAK